MQPAFLAATRRSQGRLNQAQFDTTADFSYSSSDGTVLQIPATTSVLLVGVTIKIFWFTPAVLATALGVLPTPR